MEKILNIEEFFAQHIQKGVNNTHSNYLDTALKFNKVITTARICRLVYIFQNFYYLSISKLNIGALKNLAILDALKKISNH